MRSAAAFFCVGDLGSWGFGYFSRFARFQCFSVSEFQSFVEAFSISSFKFLVVAPFPVSPEGGKAMRLIKNFELRIKN